MAVAISKFKGEIASSAERLCLLAERLCLLAMTLFERVRRPLSILPY
jgi:hypothetical protein